MKRILLVEESATRRRAVSAMLAARGFEVLGQASYAAALGALKRVENLPAEFDAMVAGWPEYLDSGAEEVFALLGEDRFEHLPVLLLADTNDPGVVNWMMRRGGSTLLLWSDYSECGDAIINLTEPPREKAALDAGSQAHLRVLFVDDSPTVRIAFRRLLMKHGYVVEVASNVEEGFELAMRESFDIGIVDYFMPGDNGAVLVKRLREHPRTHQMLTAVITGTYSDRVINEALASGAIECLFKNEARDLFLARVASLARMVLDRKSVDTERRRLGGILESVGDGVYGVDTRGVIQFINPAALDILGYVSPEGVVGRLAHEAFHFAFEDGTAMPRAACFLSQCYSHGNQVPGWQTVFWHANRRPVPVECTVYPLQIEGMREGSVVAFRDISARRQLEEELRWQATHDSLTKLYNRAAFESQLEQEVLRLKQSEQASVLLFVDLDRFKYINDTAGHGAGDQLLIEVGHRLKSRLRSSDTLARMGGDEYALILRNVGNHEIEPIADEFRRALIGSAFAYGGKTYRVSGSLGAARIDRHTLSPAEAMANADIACHIAKNRGRNQVHVFSLDTDQRAAMDIELGWSARLEEALRSDLFVLCYQPILGLDEVDFNIDLPSQDGALWARKLLRGPSRRAFFEVLLRMRDAGGDLVAPDAFLPTAERFSMMVDIDRWVIHHAFKALREQAGAEAAAGLALNLSAQSLTHAGVARYVTDKLVEFNVDPQAIVFEITESRALTNLEAVRELIRELRALGCRFALDDFGSGFSSFSHLKQLEVDYLKIDGSFTQGVLDDPTDQAVVRAITTIAHSVGKKTVAECVDRPELVRALRLCGVDFVQGYYIGRPKAGLRSASSPLEIVAGSGNVAPLVRKG